MKKEEITRKKIIDNIFDELVKLDYNNYNSFEGNMFNVAIYLFSRYGEIPVEIDNEEGLEELAKIISKKETLMNEEINDMVEDLLYRKREETSVEDFKKYILEIIETEYQGIENEEYYNIKGNIDKIVGNLYERIKNISNLEDELNTIWSEINKYKQDMMTQYDNECMTYLSLQIIKALKLENKWLLIDEYYSKIKDIYNDYKKYDNKNKSLLDSINDYITDNEDKILNIIGCAFE